MKKKLLALLITACMLFALAPAVVGAAAERLEIKLAIGSPTLSVNGATSTIQKPFKSNGTTMVPLSVITKAFGAGLKLEKNKIITLSYNKTTVVLTIGSKTVKVNGGAVALAAEPKIVNSVTMVPLRVIVSAFGATLNLSGNTITIKGFKADSASTGTGNNTSGIDSDTGKTKVGDSYYGWSMNYPSDLALADQSDNGSQLIWSSVAEDRSIYLAIDDIDQAYTRQEVRDHIQEYFNETEFAVESTTVNAGGLSYEKTVSRDRNGWYFEYHAFQAQNRIYLIAAGVKSDSRDDLNAYKSILDSFKPSFPSGDKSVKDITRVKDGFYTAIDKDYGLAVKLPVNWFRDDKSANPTFVSEDGFMDFQISSLAPGDTAEAWLGRSRKELENEFQSDYVRSTNESTIQLADGPAQVLSYEYSWDKKTWYKEYEIFFVSGTHKYEANFFYKIDGTTKGDTLYNQIVGSLDIDTAFVEKNFSELDDTDALNDLTVTKTSKTYGYSITLPQSWYGSKKDFEADEVEYSMPYGSFGISIGGDLAASDYPQAITAAVGTDPDLKKAGATVLSSTTTTIGGATAYKIVMGLDNLAMPQVITYLALDHNGKTYLLTYALDKAAYTDANRGKVEGVINTFKFNN
ncbi:Copper amine oxidase N-terminal domain-containing protein [Paenibacillus sp. UNC496MF]|nr:Copper amine oxidase N-terminal domain-containing protein [Paenibacillus sp. UNC496MF]